MVSERVLLESPVSHYPHYPWCAYPEVCSCGYEDHLRGLAEAAADRLAEAEAEEPSTST